MKVIDTNAWFEYFFATDKGKKIKTLIESGEEIATPAPVLAEVIRKQVRDGFDYQSEISFITKKSKIMPITKEIALIAGLIKEVHFSDSLMLACARHEKATLITWDRDFKGLKDVQML